MQKEQFRSVEQWAQSSNNYELFRNAFEMITGSFESSRDLLKSKGLKDFTPEDLVARKMSDPAARDAISSVYENSALLGFIARRMPSVIKTLWKKSKSQELVTWAFTKSKVKIQYL